MTTRTFIFAGGGTGGHLFPGIAVAQELQSREPDAKILFVGSERDLERSILSKYPFEQRSLPVESLLTLKRRPFQFICRNWQSWREARRLIQNEKPSAVIGLGGYASAPIVWAASRNKVPVVLLEQNAIPGRTTRWLSRWATTVCISFPGSAVRLPKRVHLVCTGNPLRREITSLLDMPSHDAAKPSQCVLILGGSQGADSLNEAVIEAARLLRGELSDWKLVHQTGPRQCEQIRTAYRDLSLNTDVEPFFEQMSGRYRDATIVISRAGATTIAEAACAGLPMILLPYPHSADNHQSANAESFQRANSAIIVEHQPTTQETASILASQLKTLLQQPDRRKAMSLAARALARPQAAEEIAVIVRGACQENRR